ncbi:DUF6493 family protein [Actinoplanes sp. NPDC048791]|uniref:DUF6493 family protein n=1 Tax=Actinoplanes sp. NPDC048791 TaxID=3154623 RepID=UPI0033C5685D
MSLEWEMLDRLTGEGEIDQLAGLLLDAEETQRRAFAKEFEARIKAMTADDWHRPRHDPARGYALIAIACFPSAAKTAALLIRPVMREAWGRLPAEQFITIARARQLPWLGDLGTRLAARVRPDDSWTGQWQFPAALLRAADAEPPTSEGMVRGWLAELLRFRHEGMPTRLVDRLRESPYLDLFLPALFTIDGLGNALNEGHFSEADGSWQSGPLFPSAVAQLVAEGRLDRRRILDATVDRLVRGDRPAALRPFTLLLEALAPTNDEVAGHALDYARLLPDAPSPIATMAQRALRSLDEEGRLELETVLEASRSVLVRKERSLVKAQLVWLERVARREPDRIAEVVEVVAVALEHPALDVQERALTLIGRHVAGLPPLTKGALAGLSGAAAVLGPAAGTSTDSEVMAISGRSDASAADPGVSGSAGSATDLRLPAPAPPTVMPPPIAGAAELAEEVVALISEESGVRWERVLAGIVTLHAAGQTSDLADVFEPVFDRHPDAFGDQRWNNRPRLIFLGEALWSVIDPKRHGRAWERMVAAVRAAREEDPSHGNPLIATPNGVPALRIAELAVEVTRAPVAELFATPTHINGSLDAETLLDRLVRAESQDRQPWPTDFEQALLRVPREVDASVRHRARALTSPAGHQFAEWLAGGGLPDPASTRFEQRSVASEPDVLLQEIAGRRVMANLRPARAAGLIENHLTWLERRPKPNYFGADLTGDVTTLAMVLPHHREIIAAWALPALARLADQDGRGGATLLPTLAECTGPLGPAMSLALTYVFGARHEQDRVAGVDAFLALAVTDAPIASAMGADMGDLCADGTVKLNRVVLALADAHRAGASAAVWDVLAAAIPPLLVHEPRGLPDLLELATQVASAIDARTEIAGLAEATAKPGSSRLTREARRLQATLTSRTGVEAPARHSLGGTVARRGILWAGRFGRAFSGLS